MQKFSSKDLPWMSYGCTHIEGAVGTEEALRLANLDFDVEYLPAGFKNRAGNWQRHPGRGSIVRTDNGKPVGIASDTYEILQYRDAFSFIDAIDPQILAAGELKDDGAAAFMVCQAPGHDTITGPDGDEHDLYVVLRTSHNGSKAIEIVLMPLRNRCMNMMSLAVWKRGVEDRWSIRHTKNLQLRLAEASRTLQKLDLYVAEYEDMSQRLAAIDLGIDEARTVIDSVVHPDLKSRDDRVEAMLDTYTNSDVNGFTGTGWGLVNAVTEYFDHRGPARSERARFGRGLDGMSRHTANAVTKRLLERR